MTNRTRGIRQTVPPGTVLANVRSKPGHPVAVKISSLIQDTKTASYIASKAAAAVATPISDGFVMANETGASAAVAGYSVTSLLDYDFGNTQGDILYRNATVWTALAPGTSGQKLKTLGGSANPAWVDDLAAIEFVIDGGGSTITTGLKGYLQVPFACTVKEAIQLADQSGSIVVDIWKCTYAQFDAGSTHPVSGDKITASAPPTIATATKSDDSTLTGWTTAIAAGDILAFNVNSVTTIQRVTLALKVLKT